MEQEYVHGYSESEARRLHDQAQTLSGLLHADTYYKDGERVLEMGCGVGAQTRILAGNSPLAKIISADVSEDSVRQAARLLNELRCDNVEFIVADIFHLPFDEQEFDHIFICFLLEHLADTAEALSSLKRVLKKDGSITVIEGDHGSCFFHPNSPDARSAINCLIQSQASAGGDGLIGRRLYPLLKEAGFWGVTINPKMGFSDAHRPHLA